MRLLLLVSLSFSLMGCISFDEKAAIDNVVITGGVSVKNGTRFMVVNATNRKLFYQHWFGQKGKPVAYCDKGNSEIYICSSEIYLIGDDYYTHETVIEPREEVELIANVSGAMRIGVKFYKMGVNFEEIYIWKELKNDT